MKRLFVFFIILFTVGINAQPDQGKPQDYSREPVFYFDIYNFYSGDSANTKVDFFLQLPFEKLSFIKAGEKFRAEYSVSVTVNDENKLKLITEKSWTEKIELLDFNKTNSKSDYNLSARSFKLAPGKYYFTILVEDLDSRKEYRAEAEVPVRTFDQELAISDIMLISTKTTSESGTVKIVPNLSRNVAAQKGGIPIFFEVYSSAERELELTYTIVDTKNNPLFTDKKIEKLKMGNTQLFYTFDFKDAGMGEYRMVISAPFVDDKTVVVSTKSFFSRWSGMPSTLKDLEKASDQMIYIAGPDEIDFIQDGKDFAEKLDRFMQFWEKKDPTQGTPENEVFNEYYRRIEFANKNFKQMLEGWRSDMGMVYVTLGSPNNVERHPFEYDSKPYEVWDYYDINRRFVFVDQTGFGDYRLVTPFFGEYRYRY
ncbi:MAG: GWxTD domain-containing protein [Ignavibacteriales bacterium]|jgi:GWxTD domain-containing protein|nr:GWxTD domain-containing protein [Ignavibacteriales bacterium]MBK8661890.1 GWxTD domain-containing protein [Ignavibacteriales bacterium]MBP7543375.1 GWxTD domain-containing protein [Ignavibacteriaceae bacterium]MBP9121737.1 GWxTD domain-containing protein [Ignavibacteriaceae bacterium]